MTNNWVACPRCDQDWVRVVYVPRLEREAFLCIDCEAFWLAPPITQPTFVDFQTFMRAQGYGGLSDYEVRDYAQAPRSPGPTG